MKNSLRKILVALATLTIIIVGSYFYLAYFLPLPTELTETQNLPTTKIFDRNGTLLYEVLNPEQGRKTYLTLDQFPKTFLDATISAEDSDYYNHVGVDFPAIARALFYNTIEGRIRSGASTITQQLVRNLLHTNTRRGLKDKLVEAAYAIRISHLYNKDQVLEKYLNTVYYGDLAYGAETAALNFFGKSLSDLDLAQQTLIAGLPQSPSSYNPFENFSAAKKRQRYVLDQLVKKNNLTQEQADEAYQEPLQLKSRKNLIQAPHFVRHILNELTDLYGEDAVNYGGLQVTTTLDLNQNLAAEAVIKRQLEKLSKKNVTNGAALVVDKNSGQILVWVGSKDFQDESIDGQVDLVRALRQPGSALKPFLYLQAFENLNYTPATIIPDLPFSFQTENGLYSPQNYDLDFHGPVRVREALANSYNIPAVRTLEKVGIGNFLNFLHKFGLTSLNQPSEYYGLSLTLGGGEVQLYQMVRAYLALANSGTYQPLTDILAISRPGEIPGPDLGSSRSIRDQARNEGLKTNLLGPNGKQNSWLISDILSDPNSRLESFGEGNILELDFPAAAKTGTTRNFNDNWTFGYSSNVVAGVWVGNSDSSPMENVSGIDGAGPIWHDLMELRLRHPGEIQDPVGRGTNPLSRPTRIISAEICKLSGLLIPGPDLGSSQSTPDQVRGEGCPQHLLEYFLKGTEPKTPDNWYFLCNTPLPSGEGPGVRAIHINYPTEYYKWAADRDLLPPPNCHPPQVDASLSRLGGRGTEGEGGSVGEVTQVPMVPVSILSPLDRDAFQLDRNIPLESQKIIIKYQINEPLNSLEILIDGMPPSPSGRGDGGEGLAPQIATYSWLPPLPLGEDRGEAGQHRLVIKAQTADQIEYTTPEISFEIN